MSRNESKFGKKKSGNKFNREKTYADSEADICITNKMSPRCGFKIGKYLLEGTDYKNALIRLISNEIGEDEEFDLTIIFFDGYYTEQKGITMAEFLPEINDVCMKAYKLSDELKNRCISDFIIWRDTVLPLEIAEAESEGLTVIEPEMYVFDPPDHDEQDEITFY
jgi:hypothetical protein